MTDFILPPEDEEYLTANFPSRWEKCVEDSKRGIVISGYELPSAIYSCDTSNLMIIIPPDYPTGLIDMFYFDPALSRKDGGAINAVSPESHFGKSWQRWSRHYPWEPGKHSIITHISYVQNLLMYD